MTPRPNIVYFVVHDIGRHIGCYNVPVDTPNLDAFAAESVRFDRAFCNSVACSPSRGCAMSGQYAHVSGGVGLAHMGWPLPDRVQTIVDHLNRGGYETIHAGMQHERAEHANRYDVDLQQAESHHTANGVDEALAYLDGRDRTRPFYLNIGSQEPHPCTWGMADTRFGGAVAPDDVYIPPGMVDTPGARRQFGRFAAAIRYMDEHFGRLLRGLERLGHAEDTLVVFTTDHGIMSHRQRSKGSLYDKGCEIALLARMPDRQNAGAAVRHLVQNIDVVPTLGEFAGVDVPADLPGRSFLPLIAGAGDYRPHEAIFTERNFHGEGRYFGEQPATALHFVDRFDPIRAVRTDAWHYIRYFDPTIRCRPWLPWEVAAVQRQTDEEFPDLPQETEPRVKEELYHVAHDPLEFINMADRPDLQRVKADLAGQLQAWMERTGDFILRDEIPRRAFNPTVMS